MQCDVTAVLLAPLIGMAGGVVLMLAYIAWDNWRTWRRWKSGKGVW